MKLADNYNQKKYMVPNNQIYIRYQRFIDKALRAPGDFDCTRETVNKNNYIYKFTDEEEEFYKSFYVTSGKYPGFDKGWQRSFS